ncbi:unannotated protein [freshwater metagenome]|uniref:UDP-N-acetylmuramate--L-alanine ligase n=1 Tax=freshwater metagenome TaxID=449393 RepID=A0A6J6U6H6_9ZZZZ
MNYSLQDLKGKRVHFVGIGGYGMSGLARIMRTDGIEVSGSDMKDSKILTGLRALGAVAVQGHRAENVEGADFLVYTSAIHADNPEMLKAQQMGIPILSRAQALAILISGSVSVAVAGAHGKTTTTSMLTVAIQSCGEDPSFSIGGTVSAAGSNAHRGTGKYFVIEADESDGSFVEYRPFGAIITNIEHDHVQHFPTEELFFDAFRDFIATIAPEGFLVYCADDAGAALCGSETKHCRTISYGVHPDADLRIDHIELNPTGSTARALWHGRAIGTLEIHVPGHHNLLDAAAALSAGLALGLPALELMNGLSTFRGAGRRFEFKGQVDGIRVIDDYGHHPTEISVTLQAAKRYATDGRVLVLFQAHHYWRTKAFATEFAAALDIADHAWVLEVYGPGETPLEGGMGTSITDLMKNGTFEPNFITVVDAIAAEAKPGDVIMTVGAGGDVGSLGPVILESLAKRNEK